MGLAGDGSGDALSSRRAGFWGRAAARLGLLALESHCPTSFAQAPAPPSAVKMGEGSGLPGLPTLCSPRCPSQKPWINLAPHTPWLPLLNPSPGPVNFTIEDAPFSPLPPPAP